MQLFTHTGGIAMTNCFLIADEESKQAVLFDAPDHTTEPLLRDAAKRGLEVTGLWLTHGHFDHFADHEMVRKFFPSAQILIHALDEEKARRPEQQTRFFGLPLLIPPLQPDGHLTDHQRLRIGTIEVSVLHTPGHCAGHVAFHLPAEEVLVGGDLIIGGSVGRTDLPDSDPRKLKASIQRVMQLPGATRLLGGHGPVTTLDQERRDNVFVRQALDLDPFA